MKLLILCLVLFLAAQSARAELFEKSGTLTCGSPTEAGKLVQTKLSTREIIATALDTDTETAKRFALVYGTSPSPLEIGVVERCDGSPVAPFASTSRFSIERGAPRNGKRSYAISQVLTVVDWTGSVEEGRVTCNVSGVRDDESANDLSAKGKCEGALTLLDSMYTYCTLKAKVGKVLKRTNDCPT